jgi:hypothetical protein
MTTLLLAGTPCSGLTLLRGLLYGNRQVFISPETALFAHNILWTGAGEQWRSAYLSFLRGESKHALSLSCPLVPPVHEHSLAAIGLDAMFYPRSLKPVVTGWNSWVAYSNTSRRCKGPLCGSMPFMRISTALRPFSPPIQTGEP